LQLHQQTPATSNNTDIKAIYKNVDKMLETKAGRLFAVNTSTTVKNGPKKRTVAQRGKTIYEKLQQACIWQRSITENIFIHLKADIFAGFFYWCSPMNSIGSTKKI